jgi:hypothetical protein
MTDPFAAVGDKCSVAIAAMILSILLLLPTSLGFERTLLEQAFGQFNLPSLPEGDTTTPSPPEETTSSSPSPPQRTGNVLTFLERGLIGSTLPTQNGDGVNENTHVVSGRFRMFVNGSLLQRFIAGVTLAAIDGSALNNVTIEETAPHRFELTPNGTRVTSTPTGSIPPFSSKIIARIYVNSNIPAIDGVPMTISTRGQVLAIEGISIEESRVTDTGGVRDVLSIIDGQTIYGTISS